MPSPFVHAHRNIRRGGGGESGVRLLKDMGNKKATIMLIMLIIIIFRSFSAVTATEWVIRKYISCYDYYEN